MSCLTDSELIALLEGALPSETRRHAELHIDACSLCLSVVAGMSRTSEPCSMEAVTPGPLLADGTHRYLAGPEIARGGMGRILAGEDRLLGRPVALKLLRRASTSLTRRFLREQRITARLQHPAIVPVHDVGVLDDGEPFLVMRLVKGQSLDRIAERAASLAERLQLLPAVIAVVDAVAYAHGEGVVHRDLKPQNVLVGPFGEVVVLDWGLARELHTTLDPAAEDPGPAEGERDMTRDGERLGTLAYMAPEQAAGHPADARADVYGLGAILYHVLTGRPPHAERTTSLSTAAVLHAPPPLVLLAPELPSDLVAIVARAMASAPAARYASAQELATDLKRWQAGRLVAAHRYSPRELLRRFLHRHRTPLLVAAAALLVLLALGGMSLWRILAERSHARAAQAAAEHAQLRAEAAQAAAEDARLRADTQRIAAEKLVQFILDDLRPRVESLARLDVLADVARAVMAYQDGSPVADAQARLRRAQAAALAGDVAFKTGELDVAEKSYRQSREAAAGAGDTEATTLVRCRAEFGLGQVHIQRGDPAAADSHLKTCMALTRNTTAPKLRAQHLGSQLGLAVSAMRQRSPAARTLMEEGLAAALAEAGDPGSEISGLVFDFRGHLAGMLQDALEPNRADEMALAAVALARARALASPGAKSLYDLAGALLRLGEIETALDERAAAERSCGEALDILRLLITMDPSNVNWIFTQTGGNRLLGDLLERRGDHDAALQLMQHNIESMERIVASAPHDLPLQHGLAGAIDEKAALLWRIGRVNGARQEYLRASDVYEQLLDIAPNGPHKRGFALTLGKYGALELEAHRIAVGQALLKRSIDLLRQELATHDDPRCRAWLAKSLWHLAESERGPAAREHIEEAAALLKPLRESMTGSYPEFWALLRNVERLQRALRANR